MSLAHGRLTVFKLGTSDLSAWTDNTSLNHDADAHDTTCYGKSAHTFSPGLKNGTFTVGGLWDAATGGPEAIIRPLLGASTTFELGPEGNAAGKTKWSGACLVKTFKTSHPVGEMIRWTADVQVSDTIAAGVYP